MSTPKPTLAIDSNEALVGFGHDTVTVLANYTFSNPHSINGPFGTVTLYIAESATGSAPAVGELQMNTLWGLGSQTDLAFQGTISSDAPTGFSTVEASAFGVLQVRPNAPQYITTKVTLSLDPGLENGAVTIEGLLSDFPIQATSIYHYGD